MREAARRGAADARALLETSAPPPGSPLADFGAGGATEAAARRVLHGLHVPPSVVAAASRLFGEPRAPRFRAPIERYAYWHGARAGLDRETWRRLSQGTAILTYHAIGAPGEAGSRFVVPARRLRRQLLLLRWSRRPVIDLANLVRSRQAGKLPPAGAVVITFDDGFADNGELAAPLLRRFGTPAALFVVSDCVGGAATGRRRRARVEAARRLVDPGGDGPGRDRDRGAHENASATARAGARPGGGRDRGCP